ncbi:Stk1 family PASTA domain-containing Ser/Thr kinase [Alicyclobacillus sp.]|uniref:Stk1 family PASTA domain-containing Ser/Thr kinase n=1 Tax=Alicyclobacillus sp. TaxID=61169 RepID=UPI0025B9B3DF|nr:Stk1 family PASTA domain-containing Ser/Thr kinase [Alicyclobacillus sp.]MCL6516422.1 Stk1 family PASTA domain-containing Ser/Thr kinase [Alicyclobacillus sp.]
MSRLLGGRYDLQEEIGGGGMAVVYRAIDTWLGRQVAVKMLRTQFAGDEEFVRRFRREAQSAASLSHPNIVNLYDVGITEDGQHYIVMEYVDGPTLKEVIRERGPLPVKEALDITMQICDALEHAHDHGIIHRDIKPHNILLTKNGQVKVTDFGIARASTTNTITHHQGDSVLGSVHYFSPEQARGAATDVKSDIYSLGVVMYEMLTRQLPFSGDSPVSVALKHLRDKFTDPREINPAVPQSVENIILRCLVKAPEHRYPNMRAVKKDLEDALIHPNVPKFQVPDEVSDATIAVPVVGSGRGGLETPDDAADNPTPRRWWRALAWTGVALVVVCIGAVAAYYIVMDLIQVPNVKVPDVRGKTVAQAETILHQAGFNQIDEQQGVNASPAGTVYDQDPSGNTEVKPGRAITLWVSRGPQQVQMPDLSGVPADEAVQQLENLGLSAGNITQQSVQSDQYGAGLVVSTDPPKGTMVAPDAKVVLRVSQGAGMTTVPHVISLSLDDAKKALAAAQLNYQVTRMQYPAPDGTVFKITPYTEGAQVPVGSTITLYVADNSGESGGGLNTVPDNGAGTAPPAQGQQVKTFQVTVTTKKNKPVHVQIYKSDAQASHQLVVDERIQDTKQWLVSVTVTPDTPGQIQVYEDGRLEQTYNVPYGS